MVAALLDTCLPGAALYTVWDKFHVSGMSDGCRRRTLESLADTPEKMSPIKKEDTIIGDAIKTLKNLCSYIHGYATPSSISCLVSRKKLGLSAHLNSLRDRVRLYMRICLCALESNYARSLTVCADSQCLRAMMLCALCPNIDLYVRNNKCTK
jgi:hypothetical protein